MSITVRVQKPAKTDFTSVLIFSRQEKKEENKNRPEALDSFIPLSPGSVGMPSACHNNNDNNDCVMKKNNKKKKKKIFVYAKTKAQISAFAFAIRIVQLLLFESLKFRVPSLLL